MFYIDQITFYHSITPRSSCSSPGSSSCTYKIICLSVPWSLLKQDIASQCIKAPQTERQYLKKMSSVSPSSNNFSLNATSLLGKLLCADEY